MALLWGCAGGPGLPDPSPVQASREALAAESATRLEEPVRLVFDWSLSEPDLRVKGRGLARVEPPYRARLDLFMENGETVVRAALVGDELRLPPQARAELIPPPALFWGTLGVFRPGSGAVLLGGERVDDGIRLSYRLPAQEGVRIVVQSGDVRSVERLEGEHVIERVRLEDGKKAGFPVEVRYRHLADFRELRLTLTSVEPVESYPPDIWSPGG